MTPEQQARILEKCLSIYERKKWLKPLYDFLLKEEDTVYVGLPLTTTFWDEVLIPEIRQRYFGGGGTETFIEQALTLYRSTPNIQLALAKIWEQVDWHYPIGSENYYDFQEALTDALNNEPNPPTTADWKSLDEDLLK